MTINFFTFGYHYCFLHSLPLFHYYRGNGGSSNLSIWIRFCFLRYSSSFDNLSFNIKPKSSESHPGRIIFNLRSLSLQTDGKIL